MAVRCTRISNASGSSSGLFRWLAGGESSYSQVAALDAPLPGFSVPATLPDFVEPGKTKITTLPNGVKIASETSPVCLLFLFSLGELYIGVALLFCDTSITVCLIISILPNLFCQIALLRG